MVVDLADELDVARVEVGGDYGGRGGWVRGGEGVVVLLATEGRGRRGGRRDWLHYI